MNEIVRSIFLIIIAITPLNLFSQENESVADTSRKNAVKIFLDCPRCDMNYTREEIPYVNYVRDVKEAEVYILVSDQNAGSGGRQYTYTFQGQGRFKGLNDTLVYTSSPDQTSTIVREKTTNMLQMGLMRYVAKSPMFDEIEIRHDEQLEAEEVVDRWNYWVFELQTSPRFSVEETYRRIDLENSVQISRITPQLKIEIDIEQNFNRQRFIEDDYDTTYIRSSRSLDNLIVKSINDHWSAGIRWEIGSSTRENYDFNSEFMPAIEYDLFPYSEATHRQLRFQYNAGVQFSDYIDSTLYNKTRETLFKHSLRVAYQVQEKWGSINLSLEGSNYLQDFSRNRVELDGYVRIRILKGLSVSVNGGVGYINDQLNLAKGELSEAERLLRLRQQATSYEIRGGISLTYVFGSIYNNVVNPRFGNGRGGGGGGRFFF
jgi:uncharacterized C2H2 Zn-finger protein